MTILSKIKQRITLPAEAKQVLAGDRKAGLGNDPGPDRCIREAVAWLGRAQDNSASQDGGASRHYSLISGWGPSYPETTGYIVPTLLDYAQREQCAQTRERAKRMTDWLVSIQLPGGGFQGGVIGATPVVPVTFNTGQILFGLAAAVREFGDQYRPAMIEAANWLRDSQDQDGCWRRFPTPFADPGEKAYETHVAWALMEADRVSEDPQYGAAALANVRWALTKQQQNGWIADCCLNKPATPLTHTLGYALRGIVEAFEFSGDQEFLDASVRMADGLLSAMGDNGHLAGRLDSNWSPAVDWVCLTGNVQIAICWFMLYRFTSDERYRRAALAANAYVRKTIEADGPENRRGAVKGSHPVDGNYGRFQYLNWACKFFIDSNLLELDSRNSLS